MTAEIEWTLYEPEPPRIGAIVVTDQNFDAVCRHFCGLDSWQFRPPGLISSTVSCDFQTGRRTLNLLFADSEDKPYELSLKPYQVLVRHPDDRPYEVIDYQDFRREWRERLSK